MSTGDVLAQLREAPVAEREGMLVSFVQDEVKAVLRLPSAPAPSVGFFDLGMDSLMSVELRNRLNQALAGELVVSATAVFDYPNVSGLARHLAEELGQLNETRRRRRHPGACGSRRPPAGAERRGQHSHSGHGLSLPWCATCRPSGRLLEAGENAVTDGRTDAGPWSGITGDPAAEDVAYRRGGFSRALTNSTPGSSALPL